MQTSLKTRNKTLDRILKSCFSEPAICLIGSYSSGSKGVWKTGKTDFGLLLSEILLDLGVIDEVASNVDTSGDYTYISDLQTLKYWLHQRKSTKLYILDEANIHLPSRRAMSNKSVDIITIFPEISKARARMLVIGQVIDSLDSELRTKGWVKATFLKVNLKTVYIYYRNQRYVIGNLPKTTITFDPYLQAPFTLKPTDTIFIDDEDLATYNKWIEGATYKELGFKHPMEANRFFRKQGAKLIQILSRITRLSGGGMPPTERDEDTKTI